VSPLATVSAVIKATNVAFEMITAGQLILARINQAQEKRKAAGAELTVADLSALMDDGDVKAALLRADIAKAKANFDES
jgi:hypothetical protein